MTHLYRDEDNNEIDFDAWREKILENEDIFVDVAYNEKNIRVVKKYCGQRNCVYKVFTVCSEDVTKYYNYMARFNGSTSATNDFNRIISAIENDLNIFPEVSTSDNGHYELKFDAFNNKHLVIDTNLSVSHFRDTREEAEQKFNELAGL